MISSLAHGSLRQSALTYTLRGMLWASAAYPLLTAAILAVATFWVNRPTFRAPHVPERRRR